MRVVYSKIDETDAMKRDTDDYAIYSSTLTKSRILLESYDSHTMNCHLHKFNGHFNTYSESN